MAGKKKNLSDVKVENRKKHGLFKFGIVVSSWNTEVTTSLYEAAYSTLIKHGVQKKNIETIHVPGTFELTLGAQFFVEYAEVDAVICLGCVIKGETPHFDYICQSVSYGITKLNMQYNIPFIFGVLTTNNLKQALERSGGKHGNKGVEAAAAALEMAALQSEMIKKAKKEIKHLFN